MTISFSLPIGSAKADRSPAAVAPAATEAGAGCRTRIRSWSAGPIMRPRTDLSIDPKYIRERSCTRRSYNSAAVYTFGAKCGNRGIRLACAERDDGMARDELGHCDTKTNIQLLFTTTSRPVRSVSLSQPVPLSARLLSLLLLRPPPGRCRTAGRSG